MPTGKGISKAEGPRSFRTASGTARSDEVAELSIERMGENMSPYVSEPAPAILSVGYRCMISGTVFVWPKGRLPYVLYQMEGLAR